MLSKVLAGVFAVAVLTAGGYAYWQYADGVPCCGTQAPADESAADTPPCCQELSRLSCTLAAPTVSACAEKADAAPEVLTVAPREVN